MTALKRIYLRCDRCRRFLNGTAVPSATTVVESRQEARRAGWRLNKAGEDICPDCYVRPGGNHGS